MMMMPHGQVKDRAQIDGDGVRSQMIVDTQVLDDR